MGVDLKKEGIWSASGKGVGENLLKLTTMNNRDDFVINSNLDFTKEFRYYNGNISLHNFSNDKEICEDTITLNSTSNLGIAFCRLASDINLDSSSYYTLSCYAKTTQADSNLSIGLSYYNTNDTWVWRGGTNLKPFEKLDTWQYFSLTFKPDANTKAICYCFTVKGVSGGTESWTIKQCKLEKGTTPTPWVPNLEDNIYIPSTIPFIENDIKNKVTIGQNYIDANQFYEI